MDIFARKQAKLEEQLRQAKMLDAYKQDVITALKRAYTAVAIVDGDKTLNAYKKQLLSAFVTSYKYLVGIKEVTTQDAVKALSSIEEG